MQIEIMVLAGKVMPKHRPVQGKEQCGSKEGNFHVLLRAMLDGNVRL